MKTPITVPSRSDLSDAALSPRGTARQGGPEPQRRGYRIPDFCAIYAVSRSQTYVEIAAGRLRVRKVGRCTIIAADDAEAWFAARAVAPRVA